MADVALDFSSGTAVYVWIEGEWLSAVVERVEGADAVVRCNGKEETVRAALTSLCHASSHVVDNLVHLDFLNAPSILANLLFRSSSSPRKIYTYSGTILIGINPLEKLKIYGSEAMDRYRGKPVGALPPHVYQVADAAYTSMISQSRKQSILITGESGAGKTETAKLVMQYLGYHSKGAGVARGGAEAGGAQRFVDKVLSSNPLLEAFGNAKTLRNDNSSRFGKYVEISFDERGIISNAKIFTYLLERTRVVHINPGERTFHIFYALVIGADTATRSNLFLKSQNPMDYGYLKPGGALVEERKTSRYQEELTDIRKNMAAIGMSSDISWEVLKVVAAILHLGNIEFTCGDDNEESACSVTESSLSSLVSGANLLGVQAHDLEKAITTRAIEVSGSGENFQKGLDVEQAISSRDALSKLIYNRLFEWLVTTINISIRGKSTGDMNEQDRPHTIGILDIYGFESFQENSFEQLCINLANERLQQQFNNQILKEEQNIYMSEGVKWDYVDFEDNLAAIQLIEGHKKSPGVFSIIDEQCKLPSSTDDSFARAVRSTLKGKPRFEAPALPQTGFALEHYAGRVLYDSRGMLDKNKDYISAEHQHLLSTPNSQTNKLIRELFPTSSSSLLQKKSSNNFRLSSVGMRFKKQLGGLMDILNATQPYYIRCIRPNTKMKPHEMDSSHVLEQLRCGGVLEATRIASAGYPTRRKFSIFRSRYDVILSGDDDDGKEDNARNDTVATIRRILTVCGIEGYQIGKTQIFMRSGSLARLEAFRSRKLASAATVIQAMYRGTQARQEAKTRRLAIVKIQRAFRRATAKFRLRRQRSAASYIQQFWRRRKSRTMSKQRKKESELNARKQEKEAMELQKQKERELAKDLELTSIDATSLRGDLDPERVHQRINLLRDMLVNVTASNALEVTQDAILELAERCSNDRLELAKFRRENPHCDPRIAAEVKSLSQRLSLVLVLYEKKLHSLGDMPMAPAAPAAPYSFIPAPLLPPPEL